MRRTSNPLVNRILLILSLVRLHRKLNDSRDYSFADFHIFSHKIPCYLYFLSFCVFLENMGFEVNYFPNTNLDTFLNLK